MSKLRCFGDGVRHEDVEDAGEDGASGEPGQEDDDGGAEATIAFEASMSFFELTFATAEGAIPLAPFTGLLDVVVGAGFEAKPAGTRAATALLTPSALRIGMRSAAGFTSKPSTACLTSGAT
mmetsp:Transcript_84187/g.148819  ORF Transcript_84187/g.148819 Transcript_84187/m.148819 type:complete len:122 (-) Transcript_84187:741-1106(-)